MQSPHPAVPKTDHPVLPVIAERWSPYAFEPQAIEREKLLSCLEAARWAPSSYNEQPWTFILAERTSAAAFDRMLQCLVEGNRVWAKNVGVLMLTIVAKLFVKNGKPNRAAEHDTLKSWHDFSSLCSRSPRPRAARRDAPFPPHPTIWSMTQHSDWSSSRPYT